MIAMTDSEVILLRKKCSLEQNHGMDTLLLTAEDARQIAPYLSKKIQAAAYFPREGHANPRLVTPAYARAAVRQGATLQSHCDVARLNQTGRKWRPTLNRQQPCQSDGIEVDMILNAAGVWAAHSASLANIHLPVSPLALMMSVTEATHPFLPHLIQRAGAKLSMKQVGSGNILIGGGWPSRFRQKQGRPDLAQRPLRQFKVDRLGLCYGFQVSSELARQAGADTVWSGDSRGGWLIPHSKWMESSLAGLYVAGELTGMAGADASQEEGHIAGIGCAFGLGLISRQNAGQETKGARKRLRKHNRFAKILNQLS